MCLIGYQNLYFRKIIKNAYKGLDDLKYFFRHQYILLNLNTKNKLRRNEFYFQHSFFDPKMALVRARKSFHDL